MILVINLVIIFCFVGVMVIIYRRLPRNFKALVLAVLFVLFGIPAIVIVGKPIAKVLYGPPDSERTNG